MRGGTKNGAGNPRWLFLAAGKSTLGAKIKIVTRLSRPFVAGAVTRLLCCFTPSGTPEHRHGYDQCRLCLAGGGGLVVDSQQLCV